MITGETQSPLSAVGLFAQCSWPSLPALILLSTETASNIPRGAKFHLIRTCTSVLHNTYVFPQGFSALPSAVPPRLPIAGICSCSVSSTQELNKQDSGNGDSNGKKTVTMMTTGNLPADSLTLILPVPQAAVTCGCLRTQYCIFFIALTSYYALQNYFFPV